MVESNNTSPNKNTSPIDPPKKTFRSVAQKMNKPNEFTNLGKAYSNNLYYNTGFGNSKYDTGLNFDAQFNELDPIGSINENRAQSESNLAKTAAGIGRIGTKAVSEIAKMPGMVVGGIMALGAEEGEGWETAFNNQWIKSISQFNEDVNAELLPVYVKKAVSEGNLMDNISSIDFWATEGADGIGFIASMLAPGAALKSLNLGHKILGTTAKGLSMINGEAKLAGAVRTLEGLGVTANNIELGAMTMANTLFESGSEAGSAMNSFEKGKQAYISKKSLEKFAELDNQRRSGQITLEQYNNLSALIPEQIDKEFNEQKGKLGRDIFVSNLAILLVPNAIQTKMIWGKGVGSQLVKDTPSLMAKIGNRGKNVLGALGSEGFLEEGTQSTVETMFTNKAKRGELTDNMPKDFNVSELVSSYIDTLNTTDGLKAIFLGGVLGGGMSAYQGGKSDIATRKQTQDILSLAEEKVGVFNRVNETDVYKRDQNGDIVYNSNNQPQYDPVKVRDVAKALNYTEQQSQLFDQAIQEGNEQVVQTLKNEAINQLITPFINKGELGIQALSQYLDTTLSTQEIAQNEDAKALKGKIIEQATYMQDQLNTYKDFSKSLINLNNPEATPQDTTDYYNMLGDLYINLKGSEYFQKGELKKLNIQKSKLLKDLGTNEVTREFNTDFIEGTSEDIYKFKKTETDPRVKLINDQIEFVEKEISEIDEIINGAIWNNEDVNKQFAEHIKANNKLREQANPENEAIVNQATETIANATTVDELKNIPKTNTPADKVIQQQADVKEAEIVATEEAFDNTERDIATQEDNDFNNITTYDGLIATEGSIITDELIPQENENNTSDEIKSIQNSEVDHGLGVKVISTDRNTGLPLNFISEQFPLYLEYEREPVNKSGKEVGFEINQNPGKNPKVIAALNAFNNKDFSNPKLLIDFLPINVQFTNEVKAPIETRRVTNDINIATELLRTDLVNNLIKGISINDIKTTIQDQYKGLLKVDDNRFANNNILQLDGVKDLNYIRENLYVVNSFGKLQNILNDKIFEFNNGKIKPNAAGEIYLTIPQANGKPFPLKLNIKKISESEAILLYEIYKEIIINEKSLDTTVSEVNNDLQEAILTNFEAELNIIGGNKNDIKLQEIIDLLIYQSANIKSQMQVVNGILYFGDKESTIDTIEQDQNEIIDFLVNQKRHQIKINPKSEIDNTKTNLKSNSADYLKYLVDNNILSTNAVVNEPTFQGYTNIYLNTGITVTNKPKVSESGVEVSSNNFEGLDFGDKQPITQPKVSESGVEVETDNTGFENLFGNKPKVENIMNLIKDEDYHEIPLNMVLKVENEDNNNQKEIVIRALYNASKLNDNQDSFGSILQSVSRRNANDLILGEKRRISKYDVELANLKNNQENVRNVQENFLSLSEIPGTVENTEIKETQDKVFNEKRTPKQRQTDFRRMDVLFKKKQEGNLTSEKELRDFEMFKQMYPQEYEKRCK